MIQEVLTMEQLNRIQIEIAHSYYTITTSEDEAYVSQLGEEIHNQVEKLMERNDSLSVNDALVLCAISYLDAYKKSEANADHLRGQIKGYSDDIARARIEIDEERRKSDELSRQLKLAQK